MRARFFTEKVATPEGKTADVLYVEIKGMDPGAIVNRPATEEDKAQFKYAWRDYSAPAAYAAAAEPEVAPVVSRKPSIFSKEK